MIPLSLSGKVALVTGGSRGIGKATALGFAKAGADVAIVSRSLPDLETVAEEIRGLGRQSVAISAHLGRMENMGKIVHQVEEELGKIDILVNNAATNPTMEAAMDAKESVWNKIMDLNLKGVFFLAQAAARSMREHGGGSIINVSSVAGISPDKSLPVYSISKAGVIMATKVMAKEWAQYNIRVNTIALGLFRTHFSEALWRDENISKVWMSENPMGRIGEPEEIVGMMTYLASDDAGYVNGSLICVDGGQSI